MKCYKEPEFVVLRLGKTLLSSVSLNCRVREGLLTSHHSRWIEHTCIHSGPPLPPNTKTASFATMHDDEKEG